MQRNIEDKCEICTSAEGEEVSITQLGVPGNPQGEAGKLMLERMNVSHEAVTLWGLNQLPTEGVYQILDIGCGGGATLGRLLTRYPGAHIQGVDHSPVSVALSKTNNQVAIVSGKMNVQEGDVACLPFENDSFDVITTVESFYFWPAPVDSLREVKRILKPGGSFCIINDIYDNGLLTERELANVAKYQLHNPTKEKFQQMLTEAGFENVQIRTETGTNWICVLGQ